MNLKKINLIDETAKKLIEKNLALLSDYDTVSVDVKILICQYVVSLETLRTLIYALKAGAKNEEDFKKIINNHILIELLEYCEKIEERILENSLINYGVH